MSINRADSVKIDIRLHINIWVATDVNAFNENKMAPVSVDFLKSNFHSQDRFHEERVSFLRYL